MDRPGTIGPKHFDSVDVGMGSQTEHELGGGAASQARSSSAEPSRFTVTARNDGDLRTDAKDVLVGLSELDGEPVV